MVLIFVYFDGRLGDHPNWHRLAKKEKKELAKQVVDAVINDYDFTQEINTPIEELIGIDNQVVNEDIITLDKMNTLIDGFYKNSFIDVKKIKKLCMNINNSHFKYIDNLLDNNIIKVCSVTFKY